MPEGVPATVTLDAARKIERASRIVNAEMSQELGLSDPLIRHTLVSVGTKSDRSGPSSGFGGWSSNISEVVIDLAPIKDRGNISAKVVAESLA
jgi:hypothetical protein